MEFLEWLKSIFKSNGDQCDLSDNSAALALSIFMVVGMFLSYLPQHIKVIKRKSSDGLSPWYQLLGGLSMCCILENTLLLQYKSIECCSVVSGAKCAQTILGVAQVVVQFACFMFMVTLFVYYFPHERRYMIQLGGNDEDGNSGDDRRKTHEYKTVTNVGYIISWFLVISGIISLLFVTISGKASKSIWTEIWADCLGLISLVVSSCQFIPQIFKTYRAKRVGALSIPTMMMQTPGSFILVYTLASMPGSNFSTWITYLFTGLFQLMLLIMCIIFTIQGRDGHVVLLEENGEDEEQMIKESLLQDKASIYSHQEVVEFES